MSYEKYLKYKMKYLNLKYGGFRIFSSKKKSQPITTSKIKKCRVNPKVDCTKFNINQCYNAIDSNPNNTGCEVQKNKCINKEKNC